MAHEVLCKVQLVPIDSNLGAMYFVSILLSIGQPGGNGAIRVPYGRKHYYETFTSSVRYTGYRDYRYHHLGNGIDGGGDELRTFLGGESCTYCDADMCGPRVFPKARLGVQLNLPGKTIRASVSLSRSSLQILGKVSRELRRKITTLPSFLHDGIASRELLYRRIP